LCFLIDQWKPQDKILNRSRDRSTYLGVVLTLANDVYGKSFGNGGLKPYECIALQAYSSGPAQRTSYKNYYKNTVKFITGCKANNDTYKTASTLLTANSDSL